MLSFVARLLAATLTLAVFATIGLRAALLVGASSDASVMVTTLRDMGLPIGAQFTYTAESDPDGLLGQPERYIAKTVFFDRRLAGDDATTFEPALGGAVEIFRTEDEAWGRHAEIMRGGQEYAFVCSEQLLRVSKRLTPEEAAHYEDRFHEAMQ